MLWSIEGADRRTGGRSIWNIEAATDDEAREKARLMGIHAASVQPRGAGHIPLSPPTGDLNATVKGSVVMPDYRGLRVAGMLTRIVAGASYFISVSAMVVGIVLRVRAGSGDEARDAVGILTLAVGIFFYGVLLHAISAACEAMRDIARNSFR